MKLKNSSISDERVRDIALYYACTYDTIDLTEVAKKFGISAYQAREIIDYGIVNCIISFSAASYIKAKAHRNQIRNIKRECQTASDRYYEKIFAERLNFVKYEMEQERIERIVDAYIENKCTSTYSLFASINFSKQELNLIFEKAILFGIISQKKVEELIQVALYRASFANKAKVKAKLDKMVALHDSYISINKEIMLLEHQLQSYYDFMSSDEAKELTYDELEERLKVFENKRDDFILCF